MKTYKIYDSRYQWLMFARDVNKPANLIDSNQYLVTTNGHSVLIDPGGTELFASLLATILHHVPIEKITDLFASHQDPDVISSLGLWNQALPHVRLHAASILEGFIRHAGCRSIDYIPIPDSGGIIPLGQTELQIIPAHYLHASANFNLYDPEAKILMSGDIGTALEAPDSPIYIDDFDQHLEKMRYFHRRWMPSNQAKRNWLDRVRKLDIDIMAPQHGRLFRGDEVKRFLDWFENLDVGIVD